MKKAIFAGKFLILTVKKENGETLKQMVLKPNEGRIELDILSDIASVEIFVNQGALSAAFYHLIEKNTPSVTISVEGGQTKLKQLTIHELLGGVSLHGRKT